MDSFTHSQQSHNSSLFSCDYKIPKHYHDQDSQSIVQHLQESQNQLHFIKVKLQQAYRKLEQQIKQNAQLQQSIAFLTNNIQQLTSALDLQRRQNYKLKQVLEKILENRKMLQDQLQGANQDHKKKLQSKQSQLDQLRKNHQRQIQKIRNQHNEEIEDIYEQHRKGIKTFQRDLQYKYQTKIANLQKQIEKVVNEKILEIGRLKHEINCYQIQQGFGNSMIVTNAPPNRVYEINQAKDVSLDFARRKREKRQFNEYREFQSGSSLGSHLQQNINPSSRNIPTNIIPAQSLKQEQEHRVGKWRKSTSVSTLKDSNTRNLTDDQQLSQYQIQRKKVQCQLSKLDRIKRPSNEDRQKLQGLQKQLYDLDSKIAGLKRKIRRKY